MAGKSKPWFYGAVAYQIYPRSFYDSNGDGVGDLKGIIKKLDYLAGSKDSLGVDAIWLSPFYKSPMADFGYDVSNYLDVDPIFGDMQDFKNLLAEAHKRGLKVLIDLVANHTSDEHPWFEQSRSSTNNPKRDWYIWHDAAKDGGLPNDWLSVFGGPAWQYDERTGQYYLHSFAPKQPDLNWDNPEVRQAIKLVMKFWLDMGVDGFRADAIYWLSKDKHLRNDPPNKSPDHKLLTDVREYDRLDHNRSKNGPKLFDYLREMTAALKDYKDAFMVVEAYPDAGKEISEYTKFYRHLDEQAAPFDMQFVYMDWNAEEYSNYINKFQGILEAEDLPVYTLGNHDKPRLASRIPGQALPVAAMMLLSLPGMAFIYYGEEIGMHDVEIPQEMQLDPMALGGVNRDGVRTPMQWSAESRAGFSKNEPWLPVANDFQHINVRSQMYDDKSLMNLYRRLIRLRKASETLKTGSYKTLKLNKDVLSYIRSGDEENIAVVLNFSDRSLQIKNNALTGKIILSTNYHLEGQDLAGELSLMPHSGVIMRLI